MKRSLENIIAVFLLLSLFSVLFIGLPITSQNAQKKSPEFPLGGRSPCGKTGLAPCRQCIFSSFLVVFVFFSFFFLGGRIEP